MVKENSKQGYTATLGFDFPKVKKHKSRIAKKNSLSRNNYSWDYPRQSYGEKRKGNSKFQGVTPAFIIWNMVQRYTKPLDLVVDPMAVVELLLMYVKKKVEKQSDMMLILNILK